MKNRCSDRTPIVVKMLFPSLTCAKNDQIMVPAWVWSTFDVFSSPCSMGSQKYFDSRRGFIDESWFLKHLCSEKLYKNTKIMRSKFMKIMFLWPHFWPSRQGRVQKMKNHNLFMKFCKIVKNANLIATSGESKKNEHPELQQQTSVFGTSCFFNG